MTIFSNFVLSLSCHYVVIVLECQDNDKTRQYSNSNDNMDEEESSDLEVDRNGNNDKKLEVDDSDSKINRIHGLPLKLNQQNFDFTTSGFNKEDNNDIEEFKCQLCHCQFMTEKSLKIHKYQCSIEFMTEKSLKIYRYQFK